MIAKRYAKYLYGLLILLPFLLPSLISNQYFIHGILCKIIIYTILILSLDLVVGYFGDISIGHAGFFAIGAYTVAVLTVPKDFNYDASIGHYYQLPFLVALALGALFSGFFGFVLGFPSLRLKGPYLAIVTIAYGLIIYSLINQEEVITNGSKGIMLPSLSLASVSFSGNKFFYVLYPFFLLVLFIRWNLINSFWGRAFEAIKYSEPASASCGISKTYYKIWGMMISASLAGLAGGLFVYLDSYVAPNTFAYSFSVEILIALIVGGVQSLAGNILGASVMVILPDLFNQFSQYRLLFYGLLLLLILYFLPKGLISLITRFLPKKKKQTIQELRAELHTTDLPQGSEFIKHFFDSSDASGEVVLEAKEVLMQFGGLTAVDKLSFKLKANRIHGLIGPNGSGKSTTINVISGIYKPTSGEVLVKGDNIVGLESHAITKKGVVRTFQNLQLFSGLTVLENVMLGLHLSYKSNINAVLLGLPFTHTEEKEMKIRAYELLDFVGLADEASTIAGNLAYGQARFLEIARALAAKPRVLLLDEPAAGLTTGEIQRMMEMIVRVKEVGIAVLLVEHHMDMVMSICDEITVLNFGEKIAEGAPQDIQKNQEVIQSYLGSEAH